MGLSCRLYLGYPLHQSWIRHSRPFLARKLHYHKNWLHSQLILQLVGKYYKIVYAIWLSPSKKMIVRMTCITWKFFWRRNPNRPYQVDQLFDRQTMVPLEGTSSRKKYQNRKHKKRRQFEGLQQRALLPPWEKYSTRTQKYLAIGGIKGENYLIISSVLHIWEKWVSYFMKLVKQLFEQMLKIELQFENFTVG